MIFPLKATAQSSTSAKIVGQAFEIDGFAVSHSPAIYGGKSDNAFRSEISIEENAMVPLSTKRESGNIEYVSPNRGQVRISFPFVERVGIISYRMELVDIRRAVVVPVVESPAVNGDSQARRDELIPFFKFRYFFAEKVFIPKIVIISV